MNRRCAVNEFRCPPSRSDQEPGWRQVQAAQLAQEFETDQGAQAVAKNREREIQVSSKLRRKCPDERRHFRKRGFLHSPFPTRQMNGTNRYLRRQMILPARKRGHSGSRI